MNFLVRKTHKYLSFFISLQLLLWTISGIYFAFNKIELVRGEQYLNHLETSFDLSKLEFEIEKAKEVEFKKRLGHRDCYHKNKGCDQVSEYAWSAFNKNLYGRCYGFSSQPKQPLYHLPLKKL